MKEPVLYAHNRRAAITPCKRPRRPTKGYCTANSRQRIECDIACVCPQDQPFGQMPSHAKFRGGDITTTVTNGKLAASGSLLYWRSHAPWPCS